LIEPQGVVLIGKANSFNRPSRYLIFQETTPFSGSRSTLTLWPTRTASGSPSTMLVVSRTDGSSASATLAMT